MYVEDLLLSITSHMNCHLLDVYLREWDRKFLASVATRIQRHKSLSTNQAQTILRLITQVRYPIMHLGLATDDDISEMLCHPQYRQPLYNSVRIPREVRHLGDNLLGFRFNQHDDIVNRIKALNQATPPRGFPVFPDTLVRPQFNWDHHIWIVPVTHHTIDGITAILNEYGFNLDPATIAYLQSAQQSRDQPSVITLADQDILRANVCDNPLLAGWIVEIADGIAL